MKTITYNPETHVLVPKGMMYEFPELPMFVFAFDAALLTLR